ncbi:MAG: hypothetical protein ACOY46_15035 [Bacillota bacterium]
MPMEQEVMPLLITGISIVMLLSFIIVLGQWIITKNSAYSWIVAHLVVLSVSLSRWLHLLNGPGHHNSMASENNSLVVGGAAVLWAFSMGLLMIGIYKLGSKKM